MDESFVSVAPQGTAQDEVKSYKIHVSTESARRKETRKKLCNRSFAGRAIANQPQVSSKYLELTKRKFEICRLPHDLELQKGGEWDLGTPKSVVEPLIDYWYVSSQSRHMCRMLIISTGSNTTTGAP